jgi:hypothetical protein
VSVLDSAIFINRLVYKMKNMAECIHQPTEDIPFHSYGVNTIEICSQYIRKILSDNLWGGAVRCSWQDCDYW